MKSARLSIAKLMIVVGVIALELAVGRALFVYHPALLLGVAPTGLALQVGLVRLIRNRGVFWAGFIAAGSLAMLSFVLGMTTSTGLRVALLSPPGRSHVFRRGPGSLIWFPWDHYWSGCGEPAYHALGQILGGPVGLAARVALVLCLPQLLLALVGGLVAGRSHATAPPVG